MTLGEEVNHVLSSLQLASGDKSPLSCAHSERSSDWSEVRPASGDKSPLSCSTGRGRAIGAR